MTIRNLTYLFNPRSIAVIGRGKRNASPDAVLQQNLINAGFDGPVMPVNSVRRAVSGVLSYQDVAHLPEVPALAIVTTALQECPELIGELGAKRTRAVLILTDQRLGALPNQGTELGQTMLDAAKPNLVRILGPDQLGFAVPGNRLNATPYRSLPRGGNIAVLTHSSAVMRSIVHWSRPREIGFSHLISLGRRLDVDEGDLLDYLAQDPGTRSILMHLERIGNPRKFMSAARAAARLKPLIVLRPGNDEDPVDDAIHDAAFRRAGVVCVDTADRLITAVETLARGVKNVSDNRLTIAGNSRSLGLLAADALRRQGGALAAIRVQAREELTRRIAAISCVDNPVDLGEHPEPEVYRNALEVLLEEPEADGVLIVHVPRVAGAEAEDEIARAIAERATKNRRLVMVNWVGLPLDVPVRQVFQKAGIATYPTAEEAARAFVQIAQYFRNQALLLNAPPSIPEEFDPDVGAARRVVANALQAGRDVLHAHEANQLLAAYRIPVVTTCYPSDPQGAADRAAEFKGPVALKALSGNIAHRTDVGGVTLALNSPDDMLAAALAIAERVEKLLPQATIEGFAVQPMLLRQGAYELTVGMRTGRHFGGSPVLGFGLGGTEVDVIDDIAYAIPPLNMQLAYELMSRTRIYTTLRTSPARPADLEAVALTLIKVSQMVIDLSEIVSLDINPLWADGSGVRVLDAKFRIMKATSPGTARLAIRPYPKELEKTLSLPDGRTCYVRPISPEDAAPLQAMVRRMPAEDRRLRFFRPIKELSPTMSARLTQLDYDREMALIVTNPGVPGQADIWGVLRICADPDLETAEYAIAGDRSMGGLGLGTVLMREIIDYAKQRGILELHGEVLRKNGRMLKLNEKMGFTIRHDLDDPTVLRVSLTL